MTPYIKEFTRHNGMEYIQLNPQGHAREGGITEATKRGETYERLMRLAKEVETEAAAKKGDTEECKKAKPAEIRP